jgi:SAM-dependent methyltransferase
MKVCLACDHRFDGGAWSCPRCGHAPAQHGAYPAFAPDVIDAVQQFDTAFFEQLAAIEPGNYWFEARNDLLVWALRRYFPAARNFLEIGCGTGFVLSAIRRALPALSLSGAEVHTEGLAYAGRRAPGSVLFQMDARHIPFAEEFDVIGAFDVLEHIEDADAVVVQMFRATRPGGGVLLTVPQHPFLWSPLDVHVGHKRRYRRRELLETVRRAGFEVLRATSFSSLLLPGLFVSRLTRRVGRRADDRLPELRVGPMANAVLATALGLERRLIARGISFPWGGSLLVVAGKRARR